jgi:hypothetical protein
MRLNPFARRLSAGSAAVAVVLAVGAPGQAAPTVRPGAPVLIGDFSCVAGFVFTDRAGERYISMPASCGALGDGNATDGCTTKVLPLETPVKVAGSVTGALAYSSWLAMQEAGEKGVDACVNNDFALVRLPTEAHDAVDPTVPQFGGPTAVRTTPGAPGEALRAYSQGVLTNSVEDAAPRHGVLVAAEPGGWGYAAYFVTPGVFGDAGAGVLDAQGRALGVISSLSIAPIAGSNGVSDLNRMLTYAQKHSGIKGLRLLPGKPAA